MSDGTPTTIEFRFRLDETGAAQEPAPPPRTEAPQYGRQRAHEHEHAAPPQHHAKIHEHKQSLFHSQHDEWYGHFTTPFRKTRESQEWRYWGQGLGRLARGDLQGAGRSALHVAGLWAGETAAATNVAAFAQGAGASAGLASSAGLAAGAMVKLAEWTKQSSDALEQMAGKAKDFSADVSLATAERNVKRTMFEMEQAQKYGLQLAQQVNARTELGIEFDRLMNGFNMLFAGVTTTLERTSADFLKGINEVLGLRDENSDAHRRAQEVFDKHLEGMHRIFEQMQQRLAMAAGGPVQKWMDQPHLELPNDGGAPLNAPHISRQNTRPTWQRTNEAGISGAALQGLGS